MPNLLNHLAPRTVPFMSKKTSRDSLKTAIAYQLSRQLFPFNKIEVNLVHQTRGLHVTLISPTQYGENPLGEEFLNEFEQLLNWVGDHPEVKVISLQWDTDYITFYPEQFQELSEDLQESTLMKLRLLIQRFLQIPSTTVFHMRRGLEGPLAELALACDLRVSYRDCEVSFNHLQLGLAPLSLGIELLHHLVGGARTRDWLLSGRAIAPFELGQTGLVQTFLDDSSDLAPYLERLAQASPKARQQTKRVLYELMQPHHWPSYAPIELESLDSGDMAEAVRANREERSPQYLNLNKHKVSEAELEVEVSVKSESL